MSNTCVTSFPPEAIDHVVSYTLDCCPDCGGKLRPFENPADVLQQVEIVATPTIVTEHQGVGLLVPSLPQAALRARCRKRCEKAGLFGPRLTALVAFMKGVCHASFSTIRKFLRDVVRVTVSRGYLAKLIAKVSESLAQAYAELFERLPGEAVLNIDETGHKENGERFWTWCFRAAQYTFFRIDKSRGSKVLVEVLGEEFNGVLGCDYFSAYRKYMRRVRRAGAVLHGPPDPRREVPADAAPSRGSGLRPAGAGGVAGTVCRDPPPRDR